MSGGSAWSTISSGGFGSESTGMASRVSEPAARSSSGAGNKDSGSFECNICLDLAQDPVVNLCGHLFCWPCLYDSSPSTAVAAPPPPPGRGPWPVCRSRAGRPGSGPPPRSSSLTTTITRTRTRGSCVLAAPLWLAVGGGNYTFSAAIGGLFPLLSFQVHGFPQATAYGPAAELPYGYGHSFHGWHGHGFPREAPQGQQVDVYLKVLLLVVGVIVIASLITF